VNSESRQIFVRYLQGGSPLWGELKGSLIRPLDAAPWDNPGEAPGPWPMLEGMPLLAPCQPSKIICVGLNYFDHAREFGHRVPEEPLIFLKALSSLAHPLQPIVLPACSQRVDHEAELALVVGQRVPMGGDPTDAVFGITCANDVTARDLQKKDGQWARAKSFDSFCPCGPYLVRGQDMGALDIQCRVNGQVRQHSSTRDLIFSPAMLVRAVSQCMTLEAGDLILTGTPGGISPLLAGDRVEVVIEGLGALINPVIGNPVDSSL
jgi:2-keto-4-pentenoate hydratase/2-oxohepta-3-ene-1,7-dioic acid hydratase in catechol pathway